MELQLGRNGAKANLLHIVEVDHDFMDQILSSKFVRFRPLPRMSWFALGPSLYHFRAYTALIDPTNLTFLFSGADDTTFGDSVVTSRGQ
jgi:hypothetical protein